VGEKLHTAFTGQSSHEDLVKRSGLRRILFDKSCLRCILLHKKSSLRRKFYIRNLLDHSGMHFIRSFLFCLPILYWLVWILNETLVERRACVDIIRVSAGVTVTVESKQQI